jgi:hypothetical protein
MTRWCKMILDKMTVCKIAAGEMPLDKMSCSQYSLTFDKMSVDMAVQNDFRQKTVCKIAAG